ncbi:MAG: HAMP domain-containing histidine kinase [Candidatus Competibacteraceae bacterium]|nr:MAG: HAMP domain-containing histidine kinase [Candidatus Competibacteraceae bacterium]
MKDLRRLLLLRILVMVGPCAMLFWLQFGLTLPPPPPGWSVALFLGWGTWVFAGLHRAMRRRQRITAEVLFACLQLDILTLALLLFFSGGASNPFVSLLLLPLITAAILLPTWQVWITAVVTVATYTVLMFYYQPLPGMLSGHGHGFQAHLWGMWLVFVISALLIAGFVARLATALRERDQQVAELREKALRDEQILVLGLFAAGAAHELGTPLSTIAVLAREMEYSHGGDAELCADLNVLRQQVDACRAILGELLKSANLATDRESVQPLDRLLEQTRNRWQLLRPQVALQVRYPGIAPPPAVAAPQAIGQTLINLLNNAADASPEGVCLEGHWDAQRVVIEIRDQGQGWSLEAANRNGEAFFSTKEDGIGIGLLLANATLERLGGRVSLRRDRRGGTCARIDLPVLLGAAS